MVVVGKVRAAVVASGYNDCTFTEYLSRFYLSDVLKTPLCRGLQKGLHYYNQEPGRLDRVEGIDLRKHRSIGRMFYRLLPVNSTTRRSELYKNSAPFDCVPAYDSACESTRRAISGFSRRDTADLSLTLFVGRLRSG